MIQFHVFSELIVKDFGLQLCVILEETSDVLHKLSPYHVFLIQNK